MNLSLGNDIVENARIQDLFEKYGERFLQKVYSVDEIAYCQKQKNPIPFLAGRFACKEAVIKALDLDPGVVLDLREIELSGTEFGKKRLVIHGKALDCFKSKGFEESSVSISHADHYSTAVAVLFAREK